MKNNPLLTIIMPCYNSWPYISQSVNSILKQTFRDFLLIIVNDGSNDQTGDYINSIKDKRVLVLHKNHSGIIESVNFVLPHIGSKYVARVDSDDIYMPNKFELQIEYLEKNPNISLVGSDAYYLSENGKTSKIKISVPSDHNKIVENLFLKKRSIIQSTMVLRSDIFKELKGYRLNKMPEDFDLFFRVSKIGQLANLTIPLANIRIHRSYSHKNILELLSQYDKLLSFYMNDTNEMKKKKMFSTQNNYSIYLNRLSLNYFLNFNQFLGIVFLIISIIFSPFTSITALIKKLSK